MRRHLVAVLFAILVPLAGCAAVSLESTPTDPGAAGTAVPSPAPPSPDLTVTVERVVDGDTLKVTYENGTEDTVRLIGVDTPEVHAENDPPEFEGVPDTAAGAACLRRWGERASEATKELEGRTVGLAFDENLDRRGYYGRLLAYVVVDGGERSDGSRASSDQRSDGGTLNFRLVEQGHARVYDSSFTRKDRYLAAEAHARRGGVGLWTCADGEGAAPSPTATADGRIAVASVHADAAGPDGENLNDEYVVLSNRGDPVDLSGWTVSDEADHTYTFGDRTLGTDERVTLHTGSGTDNATHVYWGAGSPVWNNDGDVVTVRAANGTVVARRSY